MLNTIVLVGRLTKNPEIIKENEKEKVVITLSVPRSYKNINGEYDIDFIDCILWQGVATNTVEYCKKGDLVGVRGRIQARQENEKNIIEVVAGKVTFLTSRKEESEEV